MKIFQRMAPPLVAALAMTSMSHAAPPGGAAIAAAAPNQAVDFEIFLPLTNKGGLEQLLIAQQTEGSPSYHKWLTPAEFGARFGPSAASMAKVSAAITAVGLRVTGTHTRSLHVSGTAAQAAKLLGTGLNTVTLASGRRRIEAAQPVRLPAALRQEGAVIPAFNGVPEKHIHMTKIGSVDLSRRADPAARLSNVGPYFYDDLKQAYDYPSYQSKLPNGKRLDGSGVHVAILMSSDALDSDVAAMFKNEQFSLQTGKAAPTLSHLAVDGGSPFSTSNDAAGEASLDTQQVLGGAPGASVTIVAIPDLGDGHTMDGYRTIVDENKWDIVSSSFGGCELFYTAAYNGGVDQTATLTTENELFAQGNAQGITFIASSGDSSGRACVNLNYASGTRNGAFIAGVSVPAADTNVTAVGGTNLVTTVPPSPQTTPPTLISQYVAENSDNDPEAPYDPFGTGYTASNGAWGAGGGLSVIFPRPAYQASLTPASGRAVPDVGMQVGGCPGSLAIQPCGPDRSAVVIWEDGVAQGVIGTSVSAPEFAGALTLYVETVGGRLGNINTFLWNKGIAQNSQGGATAPAAYRYFHKQIPGYNGIYTHSMTVGFDYMVGNGTPDVRRLFNMMSYAPAGNPQAFTNP